ncbi:hypothetical protein [Frigoriglobus tundricola]|uniref:Uncharacterized protein n=1 Tax=Frigoriglobus tundricola TaxID=2774151 RepID=A0A6M5YYV0_9BACT|nr:hypothetical protein [Frigoriglobus tundricola]QJW98714.1 hypothetical protein FTUN_6309 [Frigoriglobus tundricola]
MVTCGSVTFRYYNANAGTAGLAVGSFAYTPGHWYAIEVSTDQSGGSGAYKYKIQIYDFTTQTFLGTAEITNSTSLSRHPDNGRPRRSDPGW